MGLPFNEGTMKDREKGRGGAKRAEKRKERDEREGP
jgi:hypothetical protein